MMNLTHEFAKDISGHLSVNALKMHIALHPDDKITTYVVADANALILFESFYLSEAEAFFDYYPGIATFMYKCTWPEAYKRQKTPAFSFLDATLIRLKRRDNLFNSTAKKISAEAKNFINTFLVIYQDCLDVDDSGEKLVISDHSQDKSMQQALTTSRFGQLIFSKLSNADYDVLAEVTKRRRQ